MFLLVLSFTVCFICSVFTLKEVVTVEFLPHADLEASIPSISCSAQQILFLQAVSTSWLLVVLVTLEAILTVALTSFSGLLSTSSFIFSFPTVKNSITLELLLDADV